MRLPLALATCLFAATPSIAQQKADGCLSPADTAWVAKAMDAWDQTSREITRIPRVNNITAVFFDADCAWSSDTAMNGGARAWTGRSFSDRVPLPNGELIPPGVTSFAMSDAKDNRNFFVMSTPSIWRTAVKSQNGLGSLELLMTAVVLHEATHVAQMPTYGKRIEKLAAANKLPEDLNDDSIQQRFEGKAEFKESIGRETDLLLAAATTKDGATAARLAREARAAMKARQQRWYTGTDIYLSEVEDLFLTLEGSAQWAAYQWLIHPRGGAVDPRAAFGSFGWRGKWWSQNQGFALFMALDRLAPGAWKRHAFGDGAKTGLEMLDAALAAAPAVNR